MFFIVWGYRARTNNLGFAGPYTCPVCQWPGTFWLVGIERRFTLYWIPMGKWKAHSHLTICRNCAHEMPVTKDALPGVMATLQPMGSPDPLGPVPTEPAQALSESSGFPPR